MTGTLLEDERKARSNPGGYAIVLAHWIAMKGGELAHHLAGYVEHDVMVGVGI